MSEEAKAVVSFGHLRRGDRIQVDIHDPQVAGLIRAGYLKVIWKEPGDVGPMDNPVDPAWIDCLFSSGVDAGALQEAEAQIDGAGGHRPEQEDPDGA